MDFKNLGKGIWELEKSGKMRVPARVFATEKLFGQVEEGAMKQLVNVAELPGIQKAALGMPDMHWGYGFCIGGVAAFDAKEKGIVSPGGIGFDINCLKGNTRILHEFGYTKEIRESEKSWFKDSIKCLNPTSKLLDTKINAFMEFKPRGEVFKVKTCSGKEVVATAEHPFFTKKGMVRLKELEEGDKISVYSFEGVEFEEPSNRVLVREKDIDKAYPGNKNGLAQIKAILRQDRLIPLRENNERLPYLIKLLGFVQGDGHISFSKKGEGQLGFWADECDLKHIRKDAEKAGFHLSPIHKRNRAHSIDTSYGTVKFERNEFSVRSGSSSLATLLLCLGATAGNKTIKDCTIPKWLFKAPLWMKRLFLASFFGAELSSPASVSGHGFNLGGPVLSLNKREPNLANGRKFIKQVAKLLKDFGVESRVIAERDEFTNKHGQKSIRLRLQISGKPENLIKLFEKVGFEYNEKKRFLGAVAAQYLRGKERIIKERKECELEAKELHKKRLSAKAIYSKLGKKYLNCNQRFIERSLYEGRKTGPRMAFKSLKFEEFLRERTKGLGETGQVWNEIISKEEVPFDEPVYDFNVENEHHNFIANCFVVSNCGVRLLRTNLKADDIGGKLPELMDEIFRLVPAGVGEKGNIRLERKELAELFSAGAEYMVEKGFGWKQDLERIEENGRMKKANPEKVSEKVFKRGMPQIGTLGSGNHFVEVQKVEEVFDKEVGKKFGLFEGQAVVMLHSGSRGAGHQIATDYLDVMQGAMKKYGIGVPDRQLACAPIESDEGRDYLEAMWCGVNYAFANRQAMSHWVREAFEKVFGMEAEGMEMELVYDICHNVAKFEKHDVDGKEKELLVHRKGATRAMPAGRKENPPIYAKTGHPAIIPGSMGTSSYVLVGTETSLKESFASVCHGAGRVMSRHEAKRRKRGEEVKKELEEKGEVIRGKSFSGLAEEMPQAYKDIDEVIASVELSGIGRKVSRHEPLAVMKG